MTFPTILPGFSSGELSPGLWGRVDLDQFHTGASTLRNMFVNYRGGASSRAGTKFCGICLQNVLNPDIPPRLIPFQFSNTQGYALEFGEEYMRVLTEGGYVLEAGKSITAATATTPLTITVPSHGWSQGDWIYVATVSGMTQLNLKTFIINSISGDVLTLFTPFNEPVDAQAWTAYTSGGTASRLFTLETPYAVEDLPALKFAQSADVMTICHPDYPIQELVRLAANSWTITPASIGVTIAPPGQPVVTATVTTATESTTYIYRITAVHALTGEESLPSAAGKVTNSVDVAVTAGSLNLSWAAVSAAGSYNIYRAPSGYGTAPPAGSLFGYVGTAFGPAFVDGNTIPDLTKLPPQHFDPFTTQAVLYLTTTSTGTNYQDADTATISTSTGSDASIVPVIISGSVRAVIVDNPGSGYRSSDTVVFSTTSGAGAVVSITVGPSTGTYPACVAYFQQRRVYANTDVNPDTYFMSHIGQYDNFDTSIFPTDPEPIIGTPWAQQVNGIQALTPMPGGLVVLTGLAAWQVSGGTYYAPITPASQTAQPQAFNGCHATIPPIVAGYNILYVQSQGTIVRDMQYDFFANIYTGEDITFLSSHLFENYELVEWAWCEEPHKILWAVRSDGALLSCTYMKTQKLKGWARHDTNGLFQSVCSIVEPPANALYCIVKRRLNGDWVFASERMDNHIWQNLSDIWAVDCGLSLSQTEPAGNLSTLSATGDPGIESVEMTNFGSGYTSPTATIVDDTGTGAILSPVVSSGMITAINVTARGTGYSQTPRLVISDPAGEDATGNVFVANITEMQSNNNVFSASNIGDIIRVGGGVAEVIDILTPNTVEVKLTSPIYATLPDSSNNFPVTAYEGEWTISTPTTTFTGLDHLVGKEVVALADGAVITDLVVDEDGAIELDASASEIVVGLSFTAQCQSVYLDLNSSTTIQGKRKNVQAVTARVWNSRGAEYGTNQADPSTLQPINQVDTWTTRMTQFPDRGNSINAGVAIPLFTGDQRIPVAGTWAKPGQVAAQQQYPLPLNILAFIPEFIIGDSDG